MSTELIWVQWEERETIPRRNDWDVLKQNRMELCSAVCEWESLAYIYIVIESASMCDKVF